MVFKDDCGLCGKDVERINLAPDYTVNLKAKENKTYYPVCKFCYGIIANTVSGLKK